MNQATITTEKLAHYFSITEEALTVARKAVLDKRKAAIILDMVERYVSDAKHFHKNGNIVNAFAALNYSHGWLDAGARLEVFDVHDNRLFTVD